MKIGIDLGGTKTEGILIDSSGKELKRERIKTEKNYDGTINGILSIVKNFENSFGNVESIGIGMPGAISADTALIKNANSIWLNGKPLKKDLEKILNRKINLENDANCFALSEAVDGGGKGYKVVFGVIIGTGTGGGIVIDHKVLKVLILVVSGVMLHFQIDLMMKKNMLKIVIVEKMDVWKHMYLDQVLQIVLIYVLIKIMILIK